MKTLSANEAANKLQQGAILIDIRSQGEYAIKHIAGAVCLPIDQISKDSDALKQDVVIFHCLSGFRTRQYAKQLQECTQCCQEVYLLEGGLNAWQKAGLGVESRGVRLDIMRQVQIVAGGLVLLGVALGALVSPWFYGLSGFVGLGLMFAGLTGFCGMAKLLAVMPWNRT